MPAAAPGYVRHCPEHTLLYRIIERHYPVFLEQLGAAGRQLPRYVRGEFEAYLKCGRLEHGFLRVRCEGCQSEKLVAFSCKRRGFCPSCGARRMTQSAALLVDEVLPQVPMRQWVLSVPFALRFLFARDARALGSALGVVYRTIAGFQIRRAGFRRHAAECGAVTLIQRFGSALNLNVHFHMLIPDGVYRRTPAGPVFEPVAAPTLAQLQQLVQRISERLGRHLERRGVLVRDEQNSYLDLPPCEEDGLAVLQGHSITYRIALGAHQGRKAFTLQTLPGRPEGRDGEILAQADGFSLHAGVAALAMERTKLERLCRYISRPALSEQRLSLTAQGNVRYQLKTPYRDGTTHVVFEPLDFLARLAALVPAPGVNLTRFHGVFAPHHGLRRSIVPGRRKEPAAHAAVPQHGSAALSWAQRLKRVFAIDIERCERCGGKVKIIACIQDPEVIEKILGHLTARPAPQGQILPRGPPGTAGLFD